MFDSKQTLTTRLADAADLMIDFATLGEYGLEEPVGRAPRACEGDRRTSPQETFAEALFPNRFRGADCSTPARPESSDSADLRVRRESSSACNPSQVAVRARMRRGSERVEKQA